MIVRIRQLVESKTFQYLVLILIVISSIAVAIEVDPAVDELTPQLVRIRTLITALFVIEIGLKLLANWPRPWRFFHDPWHIFDFVVVGLCVIPGMVATAPVLRLGRMLRALRMITILPELRLIVSALMNSLPRVSYVGLLLFLHFFVYSVLGVTLFGKNDPGHFGSLLRAALTLFSVITLEGWVELMYTQMLGSAEHASNLPMTGALSHAEPLWAPLFFVTFILLGTMIIMNLFVGVIVNGVQEASDDNKLTLADRERAKQTAANSSTDRLASLEEKLSGILDEVKELRQSANK